MIRIKKREIEFILGNVKLTEEIKKYLDSNQDEIFLEDDVADVLRDLCVEQLLYNGFDEKYEVNEVGRELENMIDKLFIG